MIEITCSDCPRKRKTKYKGTKYCVICRMVRNLKFIGESLSTCNVCGERFAPVKRGQKTCWVCDDIPAAGNPTGHCGLCDADDVAIVDKEIAVCRPCATSPDKREKFFAALLLKKKLTKEGKIDVS